MKRSELTTEIMEKRGWVITDDSIKDMDELVTNIKRVYDGGFVWKYLRCEDGNKYTRDDWGMCSTYRVTYKTEYLEMSTDNQKLYRIAKREVELGRHCIYAD